MSHGGLITSRGQGRCNVLPNQPETAQTSRSNGVAWREMAKYLSTGAEVLESEDHVLYVFAHEIFEIQQLKKILLQTGGSLSFRRLNYLIDPENDGAIHADAVRYADALVEKLRSERNV